MTKEHSGGCQCGRIRYRFVTDQAQAYLCHCRMCQRATGGVAAALVNVPEGALEWLTEPDWYASSPIARRPFCASCGTPLGFRYNDGGRDDACDVTMGSLDDPTAFAPQDHFGVESLHEAWIDTSALPRHRTDESQGIVARWNAAGQEVPE